MEQEKHTQEKHTQEKQQASKITIHEKYMELRIFIADVNDEELHAKYVSVISDHNNKVKLSKYPDAGFDLYSPISINTNENNMIKVDYNIKCSAFIHTHRKKTVYPSGYFLCPRSSISSTPLRLANSIGIIDSGYRGNLMAKFDVKDKGLYIVEKYSRLMQIVSPDMCPILVTLVNSESELSESTVRGSGGFGSTGK
jgi:dUTP pyrophosphatase